MKKHFSIVIPFALLFACNANITDLRPHGSQTDLPELTQNNYLMGYLNENRSSYRVSFYDINIDFDIENKSINGHVTIKAESLNDLNKIQLDLAENLNILKIVHENKELKFTREFDAVIINFPSPILKNNLFHLITIYSLKMHLLNLIFQM